MDDRAKPEGDYPDDPEGLFKVIRELKIYNKLHYDEFVKADVDSRLPPAPEALYGQAWESFGGWGRIFPKTAPKPTPVAVTVAPTVVTKVAPLPKAAAARRTGPPPAPKPKKVLPKTRKDFTTEEEWRAYVKVLCYLPDDD